MEGRSAQSLLNRPHQPRRICAPHLKGPTLKLISFFAFGLQPLAFFMRSTVRAQSKISFGGRSFQLT
jgi:hypothetical protein